MIHTEYFKNYDLSLYITKIVNKIQICHLEEIPSTKIQRFQPFQPFLSKGYGVADRDGKTPVTNQTMFVIASTSKAMVGALFASLFSDDNAR